MIDQVHNTVTGRNKIYLFYPRPWPGETMSGRLPYSLLMLFSYLKDTQFDVEIVDERITTDMEAAISEISGREVALFGISSFTGVQIKNGLAIAKLLRNRFPDIPIVWGGWHPSCLPDQTAQHPLVDIVVRGQGEVTLKELALSLNNGCDLSQIKGISYKQEGRVIHNPDRELLPVIDECRFSWDAVDVEKYIYTKPFAGRSSRTIGIITSLGCPYNCGFCSVACVYKRRVFYRKIDDILDEIGYFVTKHQVESFTIDDDNFFVSPKRVQQFCEKLLERKYTITWDAGVSVDILLKNYDDEMLGLIKRAGCEQLYIGAESGSDDILRLINKKATVDQTYQFVQKMKEVGIRASISTIVGFPGVPEKEVFDTMDMILRCREINPDFDFRIFYYTPYPSTDLYQRSLEMGIEEPCNLEQWSEHTFRRFKAPWLKQRYRNQVKYFYYYYYPFSGTQKPTSSANTFAEKAIDRFCRITFENGLLRNLARWRARKRFFRFPIDAMYAINGARLRSWYGRVVKKNIDAFAEFDK